MNKKSLFLVVDPDWATGTVWARGMRANVCITSLQQHTSF